MSTGKCPHQPPLFYVFNNALAGFMGAMKLGEDRAAAVHYLLNAEQHPSSHRIKSSFSRLANRPPASQLPPAAAAQRVGVELREDPLAMAAGWGAALAHGFSLCLYGFGSKVGVVEGLLAGHVYEQVVLFRAYQPAASLPALLEALNEAAGAGMEGQCRAPLSYARRLCAALRQSRREPLILAILHLDAPCLRTDVAMEVLSMLLRLPCLRLVCTCEAMNAAGLWGPRMLGRMLLQDCTTFQPYGAEELAALLDAGGRGGAAAGRATLQSCKAVLRVLPQSAQKAYKLLAEHQLARELESTRPEEDCDDQPADDPEDPDDCDDLDEDEEGERALEAKARKGLSFNDWYNRCAQALVVSSQPAFRTQLTEFTDHSLVVGVEDPSMAGMTYYIPLGRRDLQAIIALY